MFDLIMHMAILQSFEIQAVAKTISIVAISMDKV